MYTIGAVLKYIKCDKLKWSVSEAQSQCLLSIKMCYKKQHFCFAGHGFYHHHVMITSMQCMHIAISNDRKRKKADFITLCRKYIMQWRRKVGARGAKAPPTFKKGGQSPSKTTSE